MTGDNKIETAFFGVLLYTAKNDKGFQIDVLNTSKNDKGLDNPNLTLT